MMRLPQRSMFLKGSRIRVISACSENAGLEFYPINRIVGTSCMPAVAQRLVEAREGNKPVERFLPGPAERYAHLASAKGALARVAYASDKIAWVIQRVGSHSNEDRCDPDVVLGIASMHEGQTIAVRGTNLLGRYALVSFWTDLDRSNATDRLTIARALFGRVPTTVLKERFRGNVVASLDGPVLGDTLPDDVDHVFDPSAAFADAGKLFAGAEIADSTAQNIADGILTNPTTRLYVPRSYK